MKKTHKQTDTAYQKRNDNLLTYHTLDRIVGSAATIMESVFIALVLTCTADSFKTLSNYSIISGRGSSEVQEHTVK